MEQLTAAAISTCNLVGDQVAAIENMEKWIQRAAERGATLALFPELNVSGYIPDPLVEKIAEPVPGPSTERIIKLAASNQMHIAFGLIERAGDRLYCTHVLVDGQGIVGRQRKVHTPAQEQPFWGCGDAIEVFDIGKARVGMAVCRDSFFDEMTRTFYFKGAEVVLMPFGYYNVPRSRYLQDTIHGRSLLKSAWTNGYFELVCNSAGDRPPSEIEPDGRKFPGWAGIIDPWGSVIEFVDREGNDESMVVRTLDPAILEDRRRHPNFLAKELRPELYRFE